MPKSKSLKTTDNNKRVTDFFAKLPSSSGNKRNNDHIESVEKRARTEKEIENKNYFHDRDLLNFETQNLHIEHELHPQVVNLIRGLSDEWTRVLVKILASDKFVELARFLELQRNSKIIYPPFDKVFTWSETPILEIKVVILGQDPYHGPNQAHGLAFSVLKPTPAPPSLINIFKEISSSLSIQWPDNVPRFGDLTSWAKQGVLLLNAVLTVEAGCPNSHQNRGWEKLTSAVIDHLSTKCKNIVFMLWGLPAQKHEQKINKNKHLVLKAAHPSPLSAHRGFMGCDHFLKANEYLSKNSRPVIDWFKLE